MTNLDPQIATHLDRYAAAWKANDGAAVAGFFADDGSLINPFGERAEGRHAVAAMYTDYFGTILRGTHSAFANVRVRPVEADHVLLDADQTIAAADGSVVLACHVTALLRREGDRWLWVDGRPYLFAKPG